MYIMGLVSRLCKFLTGSSPQVDHSHLLPILGALAAFSSPSFRTTIPPFSYILLRASHPEWSIGLIPTSLPMTAVSPAIASAVLIRILTLLDYAVIFQKIMLALLGLYVWEVIVTFRYDVSVFTLRRKFKYPMVFYFACRYSLLFSLIGM